jgi:hypothetical protein
MRASDATGRTATERSDKKCIAVLGMLEEEEREMRRTLKAREGNVGG